MRFRIDRVLSESFNPLGSRSRLVAAPRESCEGVRGADDPVEGGVKSKFRRGVGRSKEECSDMALGRCGCYGHEHECSIATS